MAKKSDPKNKPAIAAKTAVKLPSKTKPSPAKAKTAKQSAPAKAAKGAAYSNDDIALRAYFLSEKRRQHGTPGDEAQDWVDAERELAAESKRPKKKVKS